MFYRKKPLDTAGSISLVKNKINKDFILINGDTFIDLTYSDIIRLKSKKGFATIGLIKSDKKIKFNNLSLNKRNKVIKKEKSALINAGIYYFTKNFLILLKTNLCQSKINYCRYY